MSELHDVIHTLIDVAAGVHARLSPDEAAEAHEAVAKDLADSTSLDGPDASPEPDTSGLYPPAAPSDVFTPAPPAA